LLNDGADGADELLATVVVLNGKTFDNGFVELSGGAEEAFFSDVDLVAESFATLLGTSRRWGALASFMIVGILS
jgi:hypothetical protein